MSYTNRMESTQTSRPSEPVYKHVLYDRMAACPGCGIIGFRDVVKTEPCAGRRLRWVRCRKCGHKFKVLSDA